MATEKSNPKGHGYNHPKKVTLNHLVRVFFLPHFCWNLRVLKVYEEEYFGKEYPLRNSKDVTFSLVGKLEVL